MKFSRLADYNCSVRLSFEDLIASGEGGFNALSRTVGEVCRLVKGGGGVWILKATSKVVGFFMVQYKDHFKKIADCVFFWSHTVKSFL